MVRILQQCRRQETQVRLLGREDPLEEGMATRSSVLVWRMPWTEEPGGLQFMGSQESDTTGAAEHSHTPSHRVVKVTSNVCRTPSI